MQPGGQHIQLPKRLVQVQGGACLGFTFFFAFGCTGMVLLLIGIVLTIIQKAIYFLGLLISGTVFTIVGFALANLGVKTTAIFDEDSASLTLVREPFPLYKACRSVTTEVYPLSDVHDILWLTSYSRKGGVSYRIAVQLNSGKVVNMTPYSSNMIRHETFQTMKFWFQTWCATHRPAPAPVTISIGNGPAVAQGGAAVNPLALAALQQQVAANPALFQMLLAQQAQAQTMLQQPLLGPQPPAADAPTMPMMPMMPMMMYPGGAPPLPQATLSVAASGAPVAGKDAANALGYEPVGPTYRPATL